MGKKLSISFLNLNQSTQAPYASVSDWGGSLGIGAYYFYSSSELSGNFGYDSNYESAYSTYIDHTDGSGSVGARTISDKYVYPAEQLSYGQVVSYYGSVIFSSASLPSSLKLGVEQDLLFGSQNDWLVKSDSDDLTYQTVI
jgi:hypothetical protein